MERNLYSPPAAPVADPVEIEEAKGARPAEVTWALRLLFWRAYAANFDGKHSMTAVTEVAETLLDTVGIVLLFVPAANRWFRSRIGVS